MAAYLLDTNHASPLVHYITRYGSVYWTPLPVAIRSLFACLCLPKHCMVLALCLVLFKTGLFGSNFNPNSCVISQMRPMLFEQSIFKSICVVAAASLRPSMP